MKKQEYMKPVMRVVELRQRTMILTVSNYGMNDRLQDDYDPYDEEDEEVEFGW